MALRSAVLITRPDECYSCDFHSTCADNGEQCCGSAKAQYERPAYKGAKYTVRDYVSGPEDAEAHDCFCMFVEKEGKV